MSQDVIVFRYGHRVVRDSRVTTHACLVARAFGASKIIIDGFYDKELESTIQEINKRFGGLFKVDFTTNWLKTLKELKKEGYAIVHLTMYGQRISKHLGKLKRIKRIVVLIGSQKVPAEAYSISDYNISIGNQPHSEIAALAVFLNKIMGDKKMYEKKLGAKQIIIPSELGKKIKLLN